MKKDRSVHFFETFLCAGTSALLVAVPCLHPDYAFVSLFALVPFLWRAIRVGLIEALILGALFGTLFFFVTAQISVTETRSISLLYLSAVIIPFSIYSAAVNRIAKHIGFNVIFLAILWLPVEYASGYCPHLNSIFVFPDLDSSILVRISSLFGGLIVSFLIVLVNSLMITASEYYVRVIPSIGTWSAEADEEIYEVYWETSFNRHWSYISHPRAPPSPLVLRRYYVKEYIELLTLSLFSAGK
ncbi:hypothetical protein KAR91_10425 [Candidatus Pacearchaeota archaeon]|nr:hypothetical protein [Candidatus Pacearchaeota archaeon]